MDLFDKVEEIVMTNQSILYYTNPMPLAICVSPLFANPEQQGLGVEGRCKLDGSLFVTIWTFCKVYSIQMTQTHYKIINLTKIFMDLDC